MTGDLLQTSRAHLDAGDYRAARDAAAEALSQAPDDPELLRVAGRAGVELGEPDAEEQLRRVAELAPDDAMAWHDLGDALAAAGRTAEAREAFEKAVQLDPDDPDALVHLGHSAAASGDLDAATSALSKAAEGERESRAATSAVISLVEMYRVLGQPEQALAAAHQVAAADPDDAGAQLDVARLALELDRLDEAQAALERLREVDEIADHEVYALHALALVALRQGNVAGAQAIAREALAIDERGLSADLALHCEVEAGGSADLLEGRASSVVARVPPTREELEAAVAEELRLHRGLHLEDRRLRAEDLVG